MPDADGGGWRAWCGGGSSQTSNGSLPLLVIVGGVYDLSPCFERTLSAALYLPLLASCAACIVALRRRGGHGPMMSRRRDSHVQQQQQPSPPSRSEPGCPCAAVVRCRRLIVFARLVVDLVSAGCDVARAASADSPPLPGVAFAQASAALVSWLLLVAYLTAVLGHLPRMLRGHGAVLVSYALRIAIDAAHLRSAFVARLPLATSPWVVDVVYFLSFAGAFLHVLFAASLIPSAVDLLGRSDGSGSSSIGYASATTPDDERTPLLRSAAAASSERRESREAQPASDDVAFRRQGPSDAGPLSRLLFLWVNPLMNAGFREGLRSAADTFHLPERLRAGVVAQLFSSQLRRSAERRTGTTSGDAEHPAPHAERSSSVESAAPPSLLRALNASFGRQYYAAGALKLLADALGFCGPLLLGGLVAFAEQPSSPAGQGALYAAGLFASTLVGSLLSAHFDYGVQMVGLRMRAALVTTVYARVLAAPAARASSFSAGELVNFMSTDVDRIVNFCPSFHQLWSLPLQIGVSLYLLYVQVGIASMAGLAFAVVLVPINRWIAVKIGSLSTLMMSQKDGRVKIMTELLHGIRSVKLLAWEKHFQRRIERLRDGELRSLRGRKYLDALCVYFWATTPVIISILTFTAYSLLGHQLTAAKVFTSLSLFNMLIGPLNAFPWVINGLMEAWVSLRRVQGFVTAVPDVPGSDQKPAMRISERQEYFPEAAVRRTRSNVDGGDYAVAIDGASFAWTDFHAVGQCPADKESRSVSAAAAEVDHFRLTNLSVRVFKGSLVGVIGSVGCGKSSLLAAIAGEMAPSGDGVVNRRSWRQVAGSIALVPQTAWLQRGTVRDNVLFGRPYVQDRYEQAVYACALLDDFKILPDGDASQVGENGAMLSGGQRARLTLARAVYQDKDVYLLDDPLAAVDAKVATHIFEACILGVLAGKTRILCTHHTQFLRFADLVIAMDGGRTVAAGPPAEVLPHFASSLEDTNAGDANVVGSSATAASSVDRRLASADVGLDSEEGCGAIALLKKRAAGDGLSDDSCDDDEEEEEEKEEGAVRLSVYSAYGTAVGRALSACVLLSVLFMQGSKNVNDWWLSYWVAHDTSGSGSATDVTNGTGLNSSLTTSEYLYVYGGLAGANTIFTMIRAFLFAYGGLRAAEVTHSRLLDVVLKAPVRFFDSTPTGRVVNRFSSDVYTVDDSLPFIANILLAQTFSVLGTLVVTCYGLPWFLLVLAPLSVVYYRVQWYYRPSSRDLKRISSATLSSLYGHLSESVEGRAVIRAFDERQRFEIENARHLDLNLRGQFSALAASQWLNIRLQGLGVAMVTAVALLALVEHSYGVVNPGLVGLAMSYALSITGLLSGVVSSFTETEKQMVAVERVKQYVDGVEPERDDFVLAEIARDDVRWPSQGAVEFADVQLRYGDGLPLALDGVSLRVAPGERLGIVGRTGSGKSSLFNALYRTAELTGGRVTVDGVDVARLPLAWLRSRLAIIPQTPFLFSGTVRDNLDPGGQHADDALWSALHKCHLREAVERLGGLNAELPERGRTLSVGQSQLFCLARALLIGSRVLCIDEGTANVDRDTDRLVQATIRGEFRGSTVMTIAHRIDTVLDYDRILVLSRGRLVESGEPNRLLANPGSFLSAARREQDR